jgi:hypothetical protein
MDSDSEFMSKGNLNTKIGSLSRIRRKSEEGQGKKIFTEGICESE